MAPIILFIIYYYILAELLVCRKEESPTLVVRTLSACEHYTSRVTIATRSKKHLRDSSKVFSALLWRQH